MCGASAAERKSFGKPFLFSQVRLCFWVHREWFMNASPAFVDVISSSGHANRSCWVYTPPHAAFDADQMSGTTVG